MKKVLLLSLLGFILSLSVYSQSETDEKAFIDFTDGVGFITPDSVFGMNIRFRMQNRAGYLYNDFTDSHEFEATVKRNRLRFDGFINNTKLTYYVQLSFSRGDLGIDENKIHNIVRDAMIYYRFNKNFYVGFGQGKLPGNRQRVTSSGAQQFAERSIVNAEFNIDRDFGIFTYYSNNINFLHYNIKTAVSTGEGRNIVMSDENMAYTGRIELLPLGRFTNNGDFFEGDLEREKTPKISLGATFSTNINANKTKGQRGSTAHSQRDINSFFADVIFKYNGWCFLTEYANKMVDRPVTSSFGLNDIAFFTGEGVNTQLSYIFKNNIELAGRLAYIRPHNSVNNIFSYDNSAALGITKYINKHRTKVQFNLLYFDHEHSLGDHVSKYGAMFQVELGI